MNNMFRIFTALFITFFLILPAKSYSNSNEPDPTFQLLIDRATHFVTLVKKSQFKEAKQNVLAEEKPPVSGIAVVHNMLPSLQDFFIPMRSIYWTEYRVRVHNIGDYKGFLYSIVGFAFVKGDKKYIRIKFIKQDNEFKVYGVQVSAVPLDSEF